VQPEDPTGSASVSIRRQPGPTPTDAMTEHLDRKSGFSYRCMACSRCCRNKLIQLNPYELARIALALHVSTGDVVDRHTRDGVYLRQRADGTCVFLTQHGCGIHAHRPLVCRLYPLGRIVNPSGERFVVVTPHPNSRGLYGTDGAVGDYLEQQQAGPFMQAADAYYRLYLALARAAPREQPCFEPLDLLDLESFVSTECARRGEAAPSTLEDRVLRHTELLAERLDTTDDGVVPG
jgi:uncharacterized protein